MKNINRLFVSCIILGFSKLLAAENQISLTQDQLNNLGIKLGSLQQVQQIPLLYAPAKIVIPPDREYVVSASQAGLISTLNASTGDSVAKGQILAVINSPDLLNLQRQFLKAKNDLKLALTNYQRDKKLFNEGVISDRRWQETQARYNGYANETNEAQQLLEIAGVSPQDIKKLSETRQLSSQLTIHSPIDGVVLDRLVVAGQRIHILEPLYRIANLETLWVDINIPQEKIGSIKIGDLVLINNSTARARIILIGQNVNPQNQTVLARAVIEGRHATIRAGQTVNTQIIQTSSKPVFKVSNTAVAQSEGRFYIFIRTESGFSVQPVQILGKEGNNSIISGELEKGRQIAVKGAVALKAKWMGLGEEDEE